MDKSFTNNTYTGETDDEPNTSTYESIKANIDSSDTEYTGIIEKRLNGFHNNKKFIKDSPFTQYLPFYLSRLWYLECLECSIMYMQYIIAL